MMITRWAAAKVFSAGGENAAPISVPASSSDSAMPASGRVPNPAIVPGALAAGAEGGPSAATGGSPPETAATPIAVRNGTAAA